MTGCIDCGRDLFASTSLAQIRAGRVDDAGPLIRIIAHMAKRDIIEEILSRRARLTHGHYRAASGLLQISTAVDRGLPDEVSASLHVVGIVACVEVAAREAIQNLIDSGSPYADRVADLLKGDVRFTLDVARAFHARKVSLGEFVSHLLSVSSLTQITAYLDALLGAPLSRAMAAVTEQVYINNQVHETVIVQDVDEMMRSLAAAFSVRHIIAHEAGFTYVSNDDLRKISANAILFDRALYELVQQEAGPGTTPSALRDSLNALTEANEKAAELSAVYDRLLVILSSGEYDRARPDVADLLKATQEIFERQLEAEVSFRLALYNPGSGNSMRSIEAMVTHALCVSRAEQLKDALDTTIEWFERTKLRGGA